MPWTWWTSIVKDYFAVSIRDVHGSTGTSEDLSVFRVSGSTPVRVDPGTGTSQDLSVFRVSGSTPVMVDPGTGPVIMYNALAC